MTTISQEFLSFSDLKKNFSDFTASLVDFFGHRDEVTAGIAQVPSYTRVRSRLERTSYASLRETKVFVPTGLGVSYKTYLTVLEAPVEINEKLLKEILTPFSRWLAEALTDPDKLGRVSPSSMRDFKPHNLDKALEELGECFDKGSNQNQVPFKQAFARNADVKDVLADAETLTGRFIAIDRKQVMRKVDEISANMDVLFARLEDPESGYDLNRNTEKLLSQLLFTMGQEVEFYGSIAYQLTQVTVSLQNTVDNL